MNEAETRAELIDPKRKDAGWGNVDGTKILREHKITAGKIQTGGRRAKPLSADYVLVYKGRKLAVMEAKSDDVEVGEGVMQAKQYGLMLHLDFTYSSNGRHCRRQGSDSSHPCDRNRKDLYRLSDCLEALSNPLEPGAGFWNTSSLPFSLGLRLPLNAKTTWIPTAISASRFTSTHSRKVSTMGF